jgi:hypothetical protein
VDPSNRVRKAVTRGTLVVPREELEEEDSKHREDGDEGPGTEQGTPRGVSKGSVDETKDLSDRKFRDQHRNERCDPAPASYPQYPTQDDDGDDDDEYPRQCLQHLQIPSPAAMALVGRYLREPSRG